MIKWGIISTGNIAHTLARTINYVEGAQLCAVASRSAEKAGAFAAEFGVPKSYGSRDALLADADIDAVYIASPMSCHYADAKAALSAGKHVLCEKSVTLDMAQLEELLALAREKSRFFMEAMWMKCLPSFLQAKAWVDEGRIGSVKMIRADFMVLNRYNGENRLFRNDLGGGALLDLGVYPLTFAMSLLGYTPKSITARAALKYGVDFDDAVLLDYEEASAALTFGFSGNGTNAYIIGENGLISMENGFFYSESACLHDSGNNLIEEKRVPHRCNGYEYEIEEVDRCIEQGKLESALVPHASTIAVMRVMDEIRAQIGLEFA